MRRSCLPFAFVLCVLVVASAGTACGGPAKSQPASITGTGAPSSAATAAEQEAAPPHVLSALPEGKLLVEAPAEDSRDYRETYLIDGSSVIVLAPTQVSVSSDKRFVSYVEMAPGGDPGNPQPTTLVVRSTSAQDVFRLQAATPLSGPYWSPIGNQLVFQMAQTIYIRDIDTASQLQFDAPEGAHVLSWLAEGSKLLLVTVSAQPEDRRAYLMDADSGVTTEVVLPEGGVMGPGAEFVTFSPDGRYVGYPVGDFKTGWDLWIMEIATGRTCLVAKHAAVHQYPQGPGWLPDSSSAIYYGLYRDGEFLEPHAVDVETCTDTALETPPLPPTPTKVPIPGLAIGINAHALQSPSGRYLMVYTLQSAVEPLPPGVTPPADKPFVRTPSPGSAQMYLIDQQAGGVSTFMDEQSEFTPTAWLP